MIIRKFLDPNAPSLPQQVAENTDKLEKMSKIYKTTQNLTSSTTTININTTNIVDLDTCIIDTFLFSRNGLLFKIKSYTNETLYIEFYSDLSSTNEVITNFEFNPDVVVYENGNALIVGTITYNQDSLLEPVEAPAEINIPIIAGEGMVVDANEENDKIEIHIDNDAISNPNLLINGDFRVNQRGQTSYKGYDKYCLDRWKIRSNNSTVEKITSGVKITSPTTDTSSTVGLIMQPIEDYTSLSGKIVTFSVNVKSISGLIKLVINASGSATYSSNITSMGKYLLTVSLPNNLTSLAVGFVGGLSTVVEIEYAKLELGSVATAYSPRPYAEELALCQRYYIKNVTSLMGYSGYTNNDGTIAYITVSLPTSLRTVPTIPHSSITQFGHLRINGSAIQPTAITISTLVNNNVLLQCQATVSKATTACLMQAEFAFDCEIY